MNPLAAAAERVLLVGLLAGIYGYVAARLLGLRDAGKYAVVASASALIVGALGLTLIGLGLALLAIGSLLAVAW